MGASAGRDSGRGSRGGRAATAAAGLVRHPATWIAVLVVGVLLALASQYGFHRDELYFIVAGRHPALGYPDQPALTPLLTAGATALLGTSPTAIRILPALVVGACILLAAATARDLGGGRRAQVVAAASLGASGYLAAGHLAATATYDLLAWTVILWLVVRLLGGADRRQWLLVGVAAGIGLENKDLVLFLGASLAGGLVLARRWDVVRSPWAWSAIVVAVILWAPNLAWQAANGFPQLAMAGLISGGSDNRSKFLLELVLLAGPLLFVVAVAGVLWLPRDRAAAPYRAVGFAFLVLVALLLASGGKSYYAAGFFAPLMAAGGIRVDGWLGAGHGALKAAAFASAACASAAIVALLVLPVLPVTALAASPIPSIYKESAEQVGWPELVATVEGVVRDLPADQRTRAVVLTDNYGEAGALDLLGTGVAPVYSGHLAYGEWGPPPDSRSTAVIVTHRTVAEFGRGTDMGVCRLAATIDNGAGVANGERGAQVFVCPDVPVPWSSSWPQIVHLS